MDICSKCAQRSGMNCAKLGSNLARKDPEFWNNAARKPHMKALMQSDDHWKRLPQCRPHAQLPERANVMGLL